MAERITLSAEELSQLYANQTDVLKPEEVTQHNDTREQWADEGALPEDMTAQNIADIEASIRGELADQEHILALFGPGSLDSTELRRGLHNLEFLHWKGYLSPEFRREVELKLRALREGNKFKNQE